MLTIRRLTTARDQSKVKSYQLLDRLSRIGSTQKQIPHGFRELDLAQKSPSVLRQGNGLLFLTHTQILHHNTEIFNQSGCFFSNKNAWISSQLVHREHFPFSSQEKFLSHFPQCREYFHFFSSPLRCRYPSSSNTHPSSRKTLSSFPISHAQMTPLFSPLSASFL